MTSQPKIKPISDNSLFIEFDQVIAPEVNARVHQLHEIIKDQLSEHLVDSVAAYASINLLLNSITSQNDVMSKFIEKLSHLIESFASTSITLAEDRKVEVPVYYGPEVAPDIQAIANNAKVSIDQVIELHTSKEYPVYAIGFLPGFAYMGSVPETIATPRKSKPRQLVPAGSVGIAGEQTGIYPVASPAGWQIIGKTPLSLITDDTSQPSLLNAGDKVRFKAINQEEFLSLGGLLEWE